jgi:hypothetical protein
MSNKTAWIILAFLVLAGVAAMAKAQPKTFDTKPGTGYD